jgi:HAD superfamily hydrolase (TIGR01484 family)
MTLSQLLICTVLDRTLIPNGSSPESSRARPLFQQLVSRSEVSLAYVTGRHQALVEEAIAFYSLPIPNFAITDVGTVIYEIVHGKWQIDEAWLTHIAEDWQGKTAAELAPLLTDFGELTLQEAEKQNLYKLSYYFTLDCDIQELSQKISRQLEKHETSATVISSIDESKAVGLLDILPSRASKLHAIEFLIQQKGFSVSNAVFAGDSGNDLSVLVSPIQSVLVANARYDVKQTAKEQARFNNNLASLYIAEGNYLDMNGNYSAGILEGVFHYFPEVSQWLEIKE